MCGHYRQLTMVKIVEEDGKKIPPGASHTVTMTPSFDDTAVASSERRKGLQQVRLVLVNSLPRLKRCWHVAAKATKLTVRHATKARGPQILLRQYQPQSAENDNDSDHRTHHVLPSSSPKGSTNAPHPRGPHSIVTGLRRGLGLGHTHRLLLLSPFPVPITAGGSSRHRRAQDCGTARSRIRRAPQELGEEQVQNPRAGDPERLAWAGDVPAEGLRAMRDGAVEVGRPSRVAERWIPRRMAAGLRVVPTMLDRSVLCEVLQAADWLMEEVGGGSLASFEEFRE